MNLVPLKQTSFIQMSFSPDKCLLEKKKCVTIKSPVHIQPISLHAEHKMKKQRKMTPEQWPPFFLLLLYWTRVTREVLDITTHISPHRKKEKMDLPCSSGKIRASNTFKLSPCPFSLSILWPSLLALASLLVPSSVLFSVWQLSGPNWPRLISVSYRSWRVRPSPLNTD